MQTSTRPIKVIIADRQCLVTESIKIILKESSQNFVVEVVNNCCDLDIELRREPSDVLITDFALMDYTNVDSIRSIKETFPLLVILLLTNQINKSNLQTLINAGVTSVLLKNAEREEFLMAIDAVLRGKKYFSGEVLDMFIEQKTVKHVSTYDNASLTSSELEIVRLIAEGLTTKAIADRRSVSFHTVMTHRKNIFRKLGVTSASELLMYAVKNGMVDNVEYHI